MKLIKIKAEEHIKYIITELSLNRRTLRTNTISDAIKSLKHEKSFNMFGYNLTSLGINLSRNEEIIYEIEFEKLEDLIELVPEEFL